ncbi:class I SAM-dependent methyltransferase [Gorillibacterium massiliense]|uniref:class I SAM-dependent methyltransferase n=1 Tax=Gorillibacterium massiliense TaxID=1280390 RepID=UPI0004B17A49|nr:methyltransferase [Gorillibacterium massiliense]
MLIQAEIKNHDLRFETAEGLFSPHSVDKGTLVMLDKVIFDPGDYVLDLGCGYGVVGIVAAKCIGAERVVMADVDLLAVAAAEQNAHLNGVPEVRIIQSDGFRAIRETGFSLILANPPYHADFSVPKHFIERGFNRLRIGGKMLLVTKRREWYKNKLIAVFGGVQIWEEDGYFVFMSEKKSMSYAKIM